MFHIVLFEPEIPPNTGNIIRLCTNTGSQLHLIKPLGFEIDDKRLRRAGLDYREYANILIHENWQAYLNTTKPQRIFACSTKGKKKYTESNYQPNDAFLFGPETRGLPASLLNNFKEDEILRIPMMPNNRSLNLSNAAAVIIYEAWRQLDFNNGN